GHRLGVADRAVRRCVAEGPSRRPGRGAALPRRLRAAPEPGGHGHDQRDLRRGEPVCAARLHGAGVERGGGAALLGADGVTERPCPGGVSRGTMPPPGKDKEAPVRRALPLLAVLSLAFAPAPLPRKERATDLERLRGEWKLVSLTARGLPDHAAPDAAI